MAAKFAHAVVTTQGAALIAQATAANRIVLVGALSSASAAQSDAELAGQDKTWYGGQTGSIDAASAAGNTARIVGIYKNTSGNAQALKSAAILARLANQQDADAVVLCAVSDEASGIEIGGSSNIPRSVRIAFEVNLESASQMQAVSATAAAPADLLRFVSLWKAGDTGSGDAQTALGYKKFIDGITAGGLAVSVAGSDTAAFTLGAVYSSGDYTITAQARTSGGLSNLFGVSYFAGAFFTQFEGNFAVAGGLSCGHFSAAGEMECAGRNLYLSNGAQSSNGYTLIRSGTSTVPGFYVKIKGPSDSEETTLIQALGGTVPTVQVPDLNVQGNAHLSGTIEVNGYAFLKDDLHILGDLQVDGDFVDASLWGSGKGALVRAHITATTGSGVTDAIDIDRGAQVYSGQGWTGTGGGSITLGVSADGYTVGATTRLRTLYPIHVSSASGGGTGSAVEVLAVVETA